MPSEWPDRRNGADSSPAWLVPPTRQRIWRCASPGGSDRSRASRPPGIRSKADFLPTRRRATRRERERAARRALAAEKTALRGQRLLQLRRDLGRICRNIRRDAPGGYRQQHKHDRKGQGADTCRKVTFRRCVHRVLTLQSSPGPAFTGLTESRGKFVAGERRFSGLFPLPPRRLEWRRNFRCLGRRRRRDSNLQPREKVGHRQTLPAGTSQNALIPCCRGFAAGAFEIAYVNRSGF